MLVMWDREAQSGAHPKRVRALLGKDSKAKPEAEENGHSVTAPVVSQLCDCACWARLPQSREEPLRAALVIFIFIFFL